MVRATSDWFSLWTAPWEMVRTGMAMAETAVHAQQVIAARMPLIAEAFTSPLTANHKELGRMVSEKVSASQRSVNSGSARRMRSATNAQVAALGRMAAGGWFGPMEWMAMAERNLAIAAAAVTLPGEMLSPFHSGAAANARRLKKKS
jgi:hypothetical protein